MLRSNLDADLVETQLKRVLVIQNEHLLAAGILHLLNSEMDLHVFDTTCDDPDALVQQIKNIQPAVVVMEECTQFTDHPSFFSLLTGSPDLRVIMIDERENLMQILKIKEIEIVRSTDLLTAIREEERLPSGGNGSTE